jgi:hypothetical protein
MPLPTSNHNKRAWDLQQTGGSNEPTDVGEGGDQGNKRCRMEGEPVVQDCTKTVPLQHRLGGRMSVRRRPTPSTGSDEDSGSDLSDEEETSSECSSDFKLLGTIVLLIVRQKLIAVEQIQNYTHCLLTLRSNDKA